MKKILFTLLLSLYAGIMPAQWSEEFNTTVYDLESDCWDISGLNVISNRLVSEVLLPSSVGVDTLYAITPSFTDSGEVWFDLGGTRANKLQIHVFYVKENGQEFNAAVYSPNLTTVSESVSVFPGIRLKFVLRWAGPTPNNQDSIFLDNFVSTSNVLCNTFDIGVYDLPPDIGEDPIDIDRAVEYFDIMGNRLYTLPTNTIIIERKTFDSVVYKQITRKFLIIE